MNKAEILEQLKNVPRKPGVYIYEDRDGKVLYVGKARSLRQRMNSYFQKNISPLPKVKAMVDQVVDFKIYIVDNELEALVLECNLIKKHRPPYNVSYRDDKSYPFIAVTLSDEYPRLFVTRESHRKGTRYYGPYTNVSAVRETYDAIRKIFPFRTCKQKAPGRSTGSPCLNYHIKRCLGPCIGAVGGDEYRKVVEQISRFLEGRADGVIACLDDEMAQASEALDFERAAKIRDRLESARLVLQRQKIVSDSAEDMDLFGLAIDEKSACANVSMVRDGKLIGSESFILNKGLGDDDILGAFLTQYYAADASIPQIVLLTKEIAEPELVEAWLAKKRAGVVRLKVPQRGAKRELVALADTNARHFLDMYKARRSAEEGASERAALSLAEALGLPIPPRRIEGFDISTIQGSSSVGSMVVFENGAAKRSDYRRFKIRMTVGGPDDFAMMKEVVTRRLAALKEGVESSFRERPDLMIVDGGRPQLSAALAATAEVGIVDLPIVALAKREEELFLPGRDEPVRLPERSESLYLIQRIRDEAHRFAVSYHRRLRGSAMVASELDGIAGVGGKRKQLLVAHFGSPAEVAGASLEELQSVPGLPNAVAARVYKYYREAR